MRKFKQKKVHIYLYCFSLNVKRRGRRSITVNFVNLTTNGSQTHINPDISQFTVHNLTAFRFALATRKRATDKEKEKDDPIYFNFNRKEIKY